jgi:MFS family permease
MNEPSNSDETKINYSIYNDDKEEEHTSSRQCSSITESFREWLYESAWPGMGLFGESYLLFSIGTLKPMWEVMFPDCFSYEECPANLLHSLTYSVIVGIIVGMLVVGYLANSIGRRRGSILTASLMSIGSVGLFFVTCFLSDSPLRLYQFMTALLCILGLGVGGEYPLSASSASEKAMQNLLLRKKLENGEAQENQTATMDQKGRGRQIQLVFTMQGMGIWFQTLILVLLLLAMGQTGEDENGYDLQALQTIWRISYLIGACILVFVLVTRYLYLNESKVWAHDKEQRAQQLTTSRAAVSCSNENGTGYYREFNGSLQVQSPTLMFLRTYGVRLFGASMAWGLWDIAFYGNKLFQSSFLLAVAGENISLLEFALAAALNSTAALLGYFGAVALIDHPKVGRLRLQVGGFLITGLLFIICAFAFGYLKSSWLVTIYLFSSFFGQLGPNATTFLVSIMFVINSL